MDYLMKTIHFTSQRFDRFVQDIQNTGHLIGNVQVARLVVNYENGRETTTTCMYTGVWKTQCDFN